MAENYNDWVDTNLIRKYGRKINNCADLYFEENLEEIIDTPCFLCDEAGECLLGLFVNDDEETLKECIKDVPESVLTQYLARLRNHQRIWQGRKPEIPYKNKADILERLTTRPLKKTLDFYDSHIRSIVVRKPR